MNKHILSIITLLSIIPLSSVKADVCYSQFPQHECSPIEVSAKTNEIWVALGTEFEIPLNSQKDRFHDEWHFSSIDFLNKQNENQKIGLELISETSSKINSEPYDDFWQRAECKLMCSFKATKPGSYIVTFKKGKVMAGSYFTETASFTVHVYHDWCGTKVR